MLQFPQDIIVVTILSLVWVLITSFYMRSGFSLIVWKVTSVILILMVWVNVIMLAMLTRILWFEIPIAAIDCLFCGIILRTIIIRNPNQGNIFSVHANGG